MENKNEWPKISAELQGIHPVMESKVKLFEETLNKAASAAGVCQPQGVGLGIDACKLSVALVSDVNHFEAVGIIGEEDSRRMTDGIETYSSSEFEELIQQFAACLGSETQQQILSNLTERAFELEPKWQALLVKCAVQLREIEKKGASG